MAGFENVVRPVVFPNIRPTPKPSLAPEDDPTKGFCVIRGSSAKQVSLSVSDSVSTSKSRPSETQRRVDVARVYHEDDETGEVDKDTYVDTEVANKVWMQEPISGRGISTLADDFLTGGRTGPITRSWFYARVKEKDNIEILEKDVIRKNNK